MHTDDTVIDRYVNKVLDRFKSEVHKVAEKIIDTKLSLFKDDLESDLDDQIERLVENNLDCVVEREVEKEVSREIDRLELVTSDQLTDYVFNEVQNYLDNFALQDEVEGAIQNMDPYDLCIVREFDERLSNLEDSIENLEENLKFIGNTLDLLLRHPKAEEMLEEVKSNLKEKYSD